LPKDSKNSRAPDPDAYPPRLEDIDLEEMEITQEDFIRLTHPYGNRWLYFGDQVTPNEEQKKMLLLYPIPEGSRRNQWIIIYTNGSGEFTESPNPHDAINH
jgi:hypothetical protein